MKVLFVSDFGFDALAHSLFSGLVECGAVVVDYPYNPLFHGGVETWARDGLFRHLDAEPPPWLPPVPDRSDLRRRISSGELAPQSPQVQYTLVPGAPEVGEAEAAGLAASGAFDLAVLVLGYIRSRHAAVALARLADRTRLPPVVLVDLSKEADAVRWDVVQAFGAAAVFKNIMTMPDPRALPFPLSSALAGKGPEFLRRLLGDRFDPAGPKAYDVHCNLSPTYPRRKALSDEIGRLCAKRGWTRAPPGPYGENLLGIHESKVAFTMRGSEPDTLHYWEIPAFRTAMFCDGTMGAVHPEPFEDGRTAVFYDPDDLSGLEGLLARYLSDDASRDAVAKAGMSHCARHHSNRARAAYLLRNVLGTVSGRTWRRMRSPHGPETVAG